MNILHDPTVISGISLAVGSTIVIATMRFGSRAASTVIIWFNGALPRNIQAQKEYQDALTSTVNTLKDRVAVLETWKAEAVALEERVRGLEAQLQQANARIEAQARQHAIDIEVLKQSHAKELDEMSQELAKARAELAAAHRKIRLLEKARPTDEP